MLKEVTQAQFAKCLKQTFRIQLDASQLDVELIEVSNIGSGDREEDKLQPFSLVFRGPEDPTLPQQIYKMEHMTMGTLGIFLVPIGPDAHGMCYEAVFS